MLARNVFASLVGVCALMCAGCSHSPKPAESSVAAPAADPAPKPPRHAGQLKGTVTYRERVALPLNAVIEVRILDISKADGPAGVIAETRVPSDGHQVPIHWELRYDPAKLKADRKYSLVGRITVDGILYYAADFEVPGNPDDAMELMLVATTK